MTGEPLLRANRALRLRSLLCIAVAASLVSCGDDPAAPGGEQVGIFFDVSGDRQTRFNAAGEAPADGNAWGTWSAGAVVDTALLLVGSRARTEPRVDLFFLVVEGGARTGTFAVDPFDAGTVAFLLINVDADAASLDSADAAYILTSGTITVSGIDSTRARGTFRGDGVHLSDAERRIFIRNGTFDVALDPDAFTGPTAGKSGVMLR